MVGRHNKDGFSGNDRSLNWGEGEEMEVETKVIGFKVISGAHSGENLGQYAVGLMDCVGIMSKIGSKASIYVTS